MKNALLTLGLVAVAIPAAPVLADPPPWAPAHGRRAHDAERYDRYGRYLEPVPLRRDDRIWRGDDGRY